MDPLALLARDDKWFLGGGKGAIYAPPFPKHLNAFGYWDESFFADVRLCRLFTGIFLDANGRPICFQTETKGWRPDRLVLEHVAPGVVVREVRSVLENQSWVSELTLLESPSELNLVLWSLQDLRAPSLGTPWSSLVGCTVENDAIAFRIDTAWPAELEPDRTAVEEERIPTPQSADSPTNESSETHKSQKLRSKQPQPLPRRTAERRPQTAHGPRTAARLPQAMLPPLSLFLVLGADAERLGHTVHLAQRHDDSPNWRNSILPEKFKNGRLPGEFKLHVGPTPNPEGLAHLLQHYRLAPGQTIQLICAVGLSGEEARASFEATRRLEAKRESEEAWRHYFAGVPHFSSSDPFLTNAYWYRWYGLRLNTVDVPGLPVCRLGPEKAFSPFVTEGIGFFRNFITYSAQAHLREVAWMHDPVLALGILENLGKCQREDGSFPGHNYSCRPARDFYHADFATGYETLTGLHGIDPPRPVLEALERYFGYLIRARFTSDQMLGILIFDQNETGQEYMSRYQAASADADKWASLRIVGADSTFYAYLLARLLLRTLPGDRASGIEDWFVHLRNALTSAFEDDFFCDQLPSALSRARPAVGLYPARDAADFELGRTRIAEIAHKWLLNPAQFWLPAGFPATAASDPTFSAEGEWKEQRLNCPWNGRSWPMANSHLVDSIAGVARTDDDPSGELRKRAGEALMKAIRLMFHDDDAGRPTSFEHYNPVSGTPALYRGYDDYMHSWVVDLILRHAVGVRPGRDDVDPLPLAVDWIECNEIPHRNGRMHVRIERGLATVRIDPA